MAAFVVARDSPRPVDETWQRLTDWPRHGRYVPLTTVTVTPAPGGGDGVGTVFTAHTGIGRFRVDDPMQIVEWRPPAGGVPGRCRLEKRGTPMRGWAELIVEPHHGGSRATWREDIRVGRLPRFTDPATRLSSRLLFGWVLRRLIDD